MPHDPNENEAPAQDAPEQDQDPKGGIGQAIQQGHDLLSAMVQGLSQSKQPQVQASFTHFIMAQKEYDAGAQILGGGGQEAPMQSQAPEMAGSNPNAVPA